MAKRILVAVDPVGEVDRALSVVRALALGTGGTVRLVAVLPVPEPARDGIGRVRVTSEVQIDRLDVRTTKWRTLVPGFASGDLVQVRALRAVSTA
jgi:nucleotide-binding universal stress UspA family protein